MLPPPMGGCRPQQTVAIDSQHHSSTETGWPFWAQSLHTLEYVSGQQPLTPRCGGDREVGNVRIGDSNRVLKAAYFHSVLVLVSPFPFPPFGISRGSLHFLLINATDSHVPAQEGESVPSPCLSRPLARPLPPLAPQTKS
eukprot:scaffold225412_cov32-Tisochrysis_lutea.AAC.1